MLRKIRLQLVLARLVARAAFWISLRWVLTRAGLLCLLLAGCTSRPTAPGPSGCASACAHLQALGCAEATPTLNGTTCEAVCDRYASTPAGWDPICVSHAATCAAVDTCGR